MFDLGSQVLNQCILQHCLGALLTQWLEEIRDLQVYCKEQSMLALEFKKFLPVVLQRIVCSMTKQKQNLK